MKHLDEIAIDLFDKLRSRFQNIKMGDEDGVVTNVASDARYFDFTYSYGTEKLGKVAVYIDEDDGLSIIFSKDMVNEKPQSVKKEWYDFLKQMRRFAKKRVMNFDVRDITKTDLTRRDYQDLVAKRKKVNTSAMVESAMHGNNKRSFQNIDNARIVINHRHEVNPEIPGSRSRNIDKIFIENSNGERFLYPQRHLAGARAMARHISEGGNPYDEFGKHILSLSEEMWKLRKFKNYVNRSSVIAEGLIEYMDIINERIQTVRKTINQLRKKDFYQEQIGSFSSDVLSEVPEDVKNRWIDQLTIRQFNEELSDVFPYIYKLISETTPKQIELEDYIDI